MSDTLESLPTPAKPIVLFFHGRKGSGKSTAQRFFQDHCRGDTHVYKYASPVKDMAEAVLREAGYGNVDIPVLLEGSYKESPLHALGGLSPRTLMQAIATAGQEFYGESVWSRLLLSVLSRSAPCISHLDECAPAIVDDLRFSFAADEAHMFAAAHADTLDCRLVKVTRDTDSISPYVSAEYHTTESIHSVVHGGIMRTEAASRAAQVFLGEYCSFDDGETPTLPGHPGTPFNATGFTAKLVTCLVGADNSPSSLSSHASEADIPDSQFDFVIRNDGTLDDYGKKLSDMFRSVVLNPRVSKVVSS